MINEWDRKEKRMMKRNFDIQVRNKFIGKEDVLITISFLFCNIVVKRVYGNLGQWFDFSKIHLFFFFLRIECLEVIAKFLNLECIESLVKE